MNLYSDQFDTPNIHASDAVLVLYSSIEINAPATVVFRALRNTDTWKDWNRFVPKVTITSQPPEPDSVTAADITQIVRNTSISGSFYSDLTDGGDGSRRPKSPDEEPPPRFRLNSVSSQGSQGGQQPRMSESIEQVASGGPTDGHRASISSIGNGANPTKSAAQTFQETQAKRRASIASGEQPTPDVNKMDNTGSHRASLAPPLPTSPSSSRRKSSKEQNAQTVYPSGRAAQRAYESYMSLYGEPSVRLQNKTKMILHVRMKPASPSEYTESHMVVTDVSRPDDPAQEKGTTALTRSKTHNLERSGIYRVVWASDHEGASIFSIGDILKGSKFPKSLMQAERVHMIEPTGDETCIYRTWECMKGRAAKTVKKKYAEHLQSMFDVWTAGLRDFCEGLHAPKIDRRDFSISADEAPIVIQTLY